MASVAEAKLSKLFLFLLTILSFSLPKGDTLQVTYSGLRNPMCLSQQDQEIQIRALELTSWPGVFLLSEVQVLIYKMERMILILQGCWRVKYNWVLIAQ